jgi:hypothetical protein
VEPVVVILFAVLVYVLVVQVQSGLNFLKGLRVVIWLEINPLVGLTHRLV